MDFDYSATKPLRWCRTESRREPFALVPPRASSHAARPATTAPTAMPVTPVRISRRRPAGRDVTAGASEAPSAIHFSSLTISCADCHHVARLEIAVHDVRTVRPVERVGDLNRRHERVVERQRTALEAAGERLAFQILHDEVMNRVMADG